MGGNESANIKKERQVSVGSQGMFNPANKLQYNEQQQVFGNDWAQATKRIVGISMAFVTGILFGTSFNPAQVKT